MRTHIFYPDASPVSYTGGCHCRQIRYQVEMPSIEIYQVSDCNCSICTAWGKINFFVSTEDLKLEGEEHLKVYQFGEKRATHKFCPNCSTNLFVYDVKMPGMPDMTGWVALNVRTIDGVEVDKLKPLKFNGRDNI